MTKANGSVDGWLGGWVAVWNAHPVRLDAIDCVAVRKSKNKCCHYI